MGVSLLVALLPIGQEAAAACAPRTFSSIQPPAVSAPQPVPDPTPVEQAPAPSDEPAPAWTPPPPTCNFVYRMGFPVLGGGFGGWSLFGEPRDGGGRLHAGVDILAPKLTPVVAVRSGTVSGVHDTPEDCCWVSIRHDNGWISLYVHLNDDTAGTDDGQGVGIRPGLVEGAPVEQGEVIGWIGDSGNAEGGPPHLHFELWTPWGEPVDPGPSLYSARRRTHPGLAEEGLEHYRGAFVDSAADGPAAVFDVATALGLAAWCDQWGIRACPQDVATREAVSRWLTALGGDEHLPYLYFDVGDPIADPTAYLSMPDQCLTPPICGEAVSRGQVAALIVLTREPGSVVDEAQALAVLHARGEIDVCDPGGLDPAQILSREGAMRMLLRAWGYLTAPPCDLIS